MSYLITHTTELFHNLFFRTSECIRVIETDMKFIYNLSNKRWAGFFCPATYSYDIVPTLVKILRDTLGIMLADVDPYLSHNFDGKRMDLTCGSYSSRAYFCLRMKTLKNTMSHLAAASVACT